MAGFGNAVSSENWKGVQSKIDDAIAMVAQNANGQKPKAMSAAKELAMTGRTSDPRAAAVQLRELKKQYGDTFAQVPTGQVVPERYVEAFKPQSQPQSQLSDVDKYLRSLSPSNNKASDEASKLKFFE